MPDIRARLVACEVNTFKSEAVHACTPSLEAKRLLFSRWAKERSHMGKPLKIHFLDVRKA